MSRVVIASVDDWERVRRLRLDALAEAPDAFWRRLADEVDEPPEYWRSRLADADTVTLVALHDGQDVGMAVVGPTYHRSDVAGLFAVWVAPQARGRGVGDALVAAACEQAVRLGFDQMLLEVGDANVHARRLYERCGFVPTGRRAAFPPPRAHITEHELRRDLP